MWKLFRIVMVVAGVQGCSSVTLPEFDCVQGLIHFCAHVTQKELREAVCANRNFEKYRCTSPARPPTERQVMTAWYAGTLGVQSVESGIDARAN